MNKSEAVNTLKALIQRMENAESAPGAVEVYVSDHGGETIMSNDFQEFLGAKGIFWQTAPRATPNYNGLVERSIQSLKAMMRVLHIQSQLNYSYWPLTVMAVRMLLNLIAWVLG
jgi:transposase InsO family protein